MVNPARLTMRRAKLPEHTEGTLHDTMLHFFQTRGCSDDQMLADMHHANSGVQNATPVGQAIKAEENKILVTDPDDNVHHL